MRQGILEIQKRGYGCRSVVLMTVLGVVLFGGSPLCFGGWQSFSPGALKTAQKANRSIVLFFHASWCSGCKRQRAVLDKLLKDPMFGSMVSFSIDIDQRDAKALKTNLVVLRPMTIVIFKGHREMSRAIGVTHEESLKKLLNKGI